MFNRKKKLTIKWFKDRINDKRPISEHLEMWNEMFEELTDQFDGSDFAHFNVKFSLDERQALHAELTSNLNACSEYTVKSARDVLKVIVDNVGAIPEDSAVEALQYCQKRVSNVEELLTIGYKLADMLVL